MVCAAMPAAAQVAGGPEAIRWKAAEVSNAAPPQTDPDCLDTRLDDDLDVDQEDLERFMLCFSGPGIPAVASCDGE